MKKLNNFLKDKITNLSDTLKLKINGKKSIQALIFIVFISFYSKKETKKSKALINLSYTVLRKKIRQLGYTLIRNYGLEEFKKNFTSWLTKSDSYKSKHRVKLRIDTTKTGKKYGFAIPELERLYDYVNKCHINTHELYICLISIDKKEYVLDFELVKKSNTKGDNKTAKKMIDRLIRSLGILSSPFIHYARVSLDGAWGNGEMLEYLSGKKFQYNAVKSGGNDLVCYQNDYISLKDLERALSITGKFKYFNEKHKLKGEYCSTNVCLKKSGLTIKVVLRRFYSEKSKEYRYLMILSVNTELYDYKIAQCYGDRWGIEECIKECKQIVDLTKYSYHSKATTRNIELYLALKFICYMNINWYRVEYCRPALTSTWDVAK